LKKKTNQQTKRKAREGASGPFSGVVVKKRISGAAVQKKKEVSIKEKKGGSRSCGGGLQRGGQKKVTFRNLFFGKKRRHRPEPREVKGRGKIHQRKGRGRKKEANILKRKEPRRPRSLRMKREMRKIRCADIAQEKEGRNAFSAGGIATGGESLGNGRKKGGKVADLKFISCWTPKKGKKPE